MGGHCAETVARMTEKGVSTGAQQDGAPCEPGRQPVSVLHCFLPVALSLC